MSAVSRNSFPMILALAAVRGVTIFGSFRERRGVFRGN
jgi:hypothetical protein